MFKNDSKAISHQKNDKMKKLILTPQKDTMTICLPHDWVGKPLVCVLSHPYEKVAYPVNSEYVSEVREEAIGYQAALYRQKRKPTRKRLRRRKGGKNKLL